MPLKIKPRDVLPRIETDMLKLGCSVYRSPTRVLAQRNHGEVSVYYSRNSYAACPGYYHVKTWWGNPTNYATLLEHVIDRLKADEAHHRQVFPNDPPIRNETHIGPPRD